jgi:hypothetical protein
MRRLSVTLAVGLVALCALSVASATTPPLSGKDKRAVRRAVGYAQALGQTLRTRRMAAARGIAVRLGPCRAKYQPAEQEKRQTMSTLFGLEVVRLLEINQAAAYDSLVRKIRALPYTDKRLRASQRGLLGEQADLHKEIKVQLLVCEDLEALAQADYSVTWLETWAKKIDADAGVSLAHGRAMDKLVNGSRPALVAAGLSKANITLLLHAQTGELFLDALSS